MNYIKINGLDRSQIIKLKELGLDLKKNNKSSSLHFASRDLTNPEIILLATQSVVTILAIFFQENPFTDKKTSRKKEKFSIELFEEKGKDHKTKIKIDYSFDSKDAESNSKLLKGLKNIIEEIKSSKE